MGLNRLRRIKIGGFFRKIALRRDPANLVVIVVAFVRICEDHSTDRHYVAIFKGYLFGNIYWSVLLVFSSLLVSAVMFHASVSEQTPDTPVSLAVWLIQSTNLGCQLSQKSYSTFMNTMKVIRLRIRLWMAIFNHFRTLKNRIGHIPTLYSKHLLFI